MKEETIRELLEWYSEQLYGDKFKLGREEHSLLTELVALAVAKREEEIYEIIEKFKKSDGAQLNDHGFIKDQYILEKIFLAIKNKPV